MTEAAVRPSAQELRAQFERDGFVHVRGLVPADEIAALGRAVDAAVAKRKQGDPRALEDKTPYEQSFTQCQYLWEDFPDVRRLTFHPAVCETAAALLGAEKLRLWHDQALYKQAGGRETEPHQDQPYWPIAERDTVTAWIALSPVTEANGAMGYCPGTHKGEAQFIDIFTTQGAGEALKAEIERAPPVFVPCAPGDVVFHHGCTIHQARANTTEETRRAHTAIYFKDGCTRASAQPHPSVDRDAIAPGAVIDGRATPVAWPLEGGGLSEPAPWPHTNDDRAVRAKALGVIPGGSS